MSQSKEKTYAIARPDQLLSQHLLGVADKTSKLAKKLSLEKAGYLVGLLHDFGKYSEEFQRYIKAIVQENDKSISSFEYDEDQEAYDHKQQKGKIDHSTAGAQWIWQTFASFNKQGHGRLVAQILSICIASHHSGLIDFTNENGQAFLKRIEKDDQKTHLNESITKCDEEIKQHITDLDRTVFIKQFFSCIKPILHTQAEPKLHFYLGMLTKFLFSCLIDADRLDSAGREVEKQIVWNDLLFQFESVLEKFEPEKPIDHIRQTISKACVDAAKKPQGIYRLTVPTGGGKTYASLRYALHHAEQHKLDRIIYVIPFTSIIEQNADQIRKILNDTVDSKWVLEHHSNLEPEQQTWHSKLACENWDRPIVLTTMVQFLEVLFSSGTRGVRRLHQLTNSVLIFDEIQSLPIKCLYLFCNAINFLTLYAKSTAVLCTATQPSLDILKNKEKGILNIPAENELMGNANDLNVLFNDLSRVEVKNICKRPAWQDDDITEFIVEQFSKTNSVLVIVNTKKSAQTLFNLCGSEIEFEAVFYLSTNLYPAHRKARLEKIRERLDKKLPVLCISTQLIEAGVDISFKTVIRYLAGLDSIAQAAGRCNRHAEMGKEKGKVFIINSASENLGQLIEIKMGQEATERVLYDLSKLATHHEKAELDLLHPESIKGYFNYYFEKLSGEMDYCITPHDLALNSASASKRPSYDTNMLELLSDNRNGIEDLYEQQLPCLRQAFKTAGNNFAAIDAPTKSLIIKHAEGNAIITKLCGFAKEFNAKGFYELLRKAQRYTVNVYPNDWQQLIKAKAITEIQGEGIFYLDERYYSEQFGVSIGEVSKMGVEIF